MLIKYENRLSVRRDPQWCRGMVGIKHKKIRRFRYPFWVYEYKAKVRYVECGCLNCPMTFNTLDNLSAPLKIPIKKIDDYDPYEVQVKFNEKTLPIQGVLLPKRNTLGWINQRMILDSTIDFINRA